MDTTKTRHPAWCDQVNSCSELGGVTRHCSASLNVSTTMADGGHGGDVDGGQIMVSTVFYDDALVGDRLVMVDVPSLGVCLALRRAEARALAGALTAMAGLPPRPPGAH